MNVFQNSQGKPILLKMVTGIQNNKAFLSEVDGLIGDGDHGMNMNKGFTVFKNRYDADDYSLSEGLSNLSEVLMGEIGGSMGPIYGTVFMAMSDSLEEVENIGLPEFTTAVRSGLEELYEIVDARPGDKTLVDCLSPALTALENSLCNKAAFSEALADMKEAALHGRDATKDMVAKYGRSSRLGERSKGVLDAGSCSCCILLTAMADGIMGLLAE